MKFIVIGNFISDQEEKREQEQIKFLENSFQVDSLLLLLNSEIPLNKTFFIADQKYFSTKYLLFTLGKNTNRHKKYISLSPNFNS